MEFTQNINAIISLAALFLLPTHSADEVPNKSKMVEEQHENTFAVSEVEEQFVKLTQQLTLERTPAKEQVVTEEAPDNTNEKHTETFEATFYTAFCPTGCIGVTATGYDVSNTIYVDGLRVIAVDPNVIPLHSVVQLTFADGTSFKARALDTGGDIQDHRIDILVENRDEAYRLGRQQVEIEILE